MPIPENLTPWEIGKGRIIRQGERLAVLSIGTRLHDALLAAEKLGDAGIEITVADARFAKPIDADLIDGLIRDHDALVIVEEGSIGGFASHVMQHLHNQGAMDQGQKALRVLTLPDRMIDHNSQTNQLAEAGLDTAAILEVAASLIDVDLAKRGVVV